VWISRYALSLLHTSSSFVRETDNSNSINQAESDGTLLADKHQIYDSLAAKTWALRLAAEAANSVLSVDSIIMSKAAGGPKVPQQAGNWDADD
jgi:chaperonin GroEL (HSP60 family)